MTMKVLFLDDDPDRMKHARRHFMNETLSEAQTAEQAIKMLEKYSPYDLPYLMETDLIVLADCNCWIDNDVDSIALFV